MINSLDLLKKYGKPCDATNQVQITLPYPMRLAWNKEKRTNKVTVHKLIAKNFENVFKDILAHYGLPKIQELGIDLFGGTFNCRKMRGGTAMSKHAWSVAIDLHPEANALKTPFKDALFSKPEYNKLHEIFEKHGFINLGKVKNMDAMHWEIAN
jgi:hypothetical protein